MFRILLWTKCDITQPLSISRALTNTFMSSFRDRGETACSAMCVVCKYRQISATKVDFRAALASACCIFELIRLTHAPCLVH